MSVICQGCGLRHRDRDLSCMDAERHRKDLDLAILRRALRWALGEIGKFGPRPESMPAYWWRTELRKRAGKALNRK